MKFLATIILFILSSLWYYISYNYLIELIPNTIFNNYNNYSILIFLAWMFVFWILFWKTLSKKEKILNKKIKNKNLSEELLENNEKRNYSEEIFIATNEKEGIIETYHNYENDYEITKNNIDIILDERESNYKHKINFKNETLKNSVSSKKRNFILEGSEIKNQYDIKTNTIQKEINNEDTMFLNVANNLKKQKKQDLTLIEGIWPKIQELLNKGWIYSYKDLANSEISKIKNILKNAGKRYLMLHNPSTWSKQAEIANNWNFRELEKYQKRLVKWVEK